MDGDKIFYINFKEPKDGKTKYYFGSLSAIYSHFTVDDIGCSLNNLWNYGLTESKPYESKKCIIYKGKLIRKKTERGKKNV